MLVQSSFLLGRWIGDRWSSHDSVRLRKATGAELTSGPQPLSLYIKPGIRFLVRGSRLRVVIYCFYFRVFNLCIGCYVGRAMRGVKGVQERWVYEMRRIGP